MEKKTPVWQLAALVVAGTFAASWLLIPGEAAPPPGQVTAAEYGDKWPLIAQEATLGCEPPTKAYIEIEGRRCGLNGKALKAGMPSCDAAAKDGHGFKITSAFIDRALTFCASRK